jgi:CDP-4-dehydro-6-deoxyglucose reductase
LSDVGRAGLLREAKRGSDYDWGTVWTELSDAGVSDGKRAAIETLAERFERAYPSLLRLRVRPDGKVDFSPGQYVTLRARETPRAYSIASSPTEEHLEFAIRRVPGGRLTSDLFTHVREGEDVVVRGPNGHMVLDEPSKRDVVFLSTGTGVAPFKSMIDYLFERGWDEYGGTKRDVWLFQGCAWADDVPYYHEFLELDRVLDNFHFVPTLTREPLLSEWDGETDYVQHVFLQYLRDDALADADLPAGLADSAGASPDSDRQARIDPANVEVYACGITAMVETLVRAARAAGVPERHMQYEGFG